MTADQEARLLAACKNVGAAMGNSVNRSGPRAWDNTIHAIGQMMDLLAEITPDDEDWA